MEQLNAERQLLNQTIQINLKLFARLINAQKKLKKLATITDYLRVTSWAEMHAYSNIKQGMPRNQYAWRTGRAEIANAIFGILFVNEAAHLVELVFTYAPTSVLEVELAKRIELENWLNHVKTAQTRVETQLHNIYLLTKNALNQEIKNVAPIVWARWQGRFEFARSVKKYLEQKWLAPPIFDILI